MVYKLSNPRAHFVEGFKKGVLKLRGVHFEEKTGIQEITVKELMWPTNGLPLYFDKAIILVG